MNNNNKMLTLIFSLLFLFLMIIILDYTSITKYLGMLIKNPSILVFNLIPIIIMYLFFYMAKQNFYKAKQRADRIHIKSITDNMTGVYNRAGLYELGNVKLDIAREEGYSFGAIFIDIDKFKIFNDTYGHMVGDIIIKQVAEVLKKSVRLETDIIVRYGGDEFIILLSNIESSTLYALAKRIQKTIKQIKVNKINDNITLSMGLTFIDKITNDNTLDKIIEVSDKALYKSKNKGGNQYQIN